MKIHFCCEHIKDRMSGALIGVLVQHKKEKGIVCYMCSKDFKKKKRRK